VRAIAARVPARLGRRGEREGGLGCHDRGLRCGCSSLTTVKVSHVSVNHPQEIPFFHQVLKFLLAVVT
jgi:hypothetical protein